MNRRYFVILDEDAAPDAVQFQWLLHARSPMTLLPERNEIIQSQGDARLLVRFVTPAVGALNFRQSDVFEPPVNAGYQVKMPNEWHVTAETIARTKQQDFLTLLYPWHAAESGVFPGSPGILAVKGHAMRLSGQGVEDLVIMARDAEKQVDAAGWQLAGVAASLSTQGDTLRFALVETESLAGPFALKASRPISAEGERSARGLLLRAQLRAPLTLQLQPGFLVRELAGAQRWGQAPDGSVTVELAAGAVALNLKP